VLCSWSYLWYRTCVSSHYKPMAGTRNSICTVLGYIVQARISVSDWSYILVHGCGILGFVTRFQLRQNCHWWDVFLLMTSSWVIVITCVDFVPLSEVWLITWNFEFHDCSFGHNRKETWPRTRVSFLLYRVWTDSFRYNSIQFCLQAQTCYDNLHRKTNCIEFLLNYKIP
jgi:hypothetical protein